MISASILSTSSLPHLIPWPIALALALVEIDRETDDVSE